MRILGPRMENGNDYTFRTSFRNFYSLDFYRVYTNDYARGA